ncbi:MAG: flavocytochrome c [Eubacteriales bacterium]|nr:flavocytochrome c [Eubacteriales bacterium]
MNSRKKGLISLVAMVVLTLALILGSDGIYNMFLQKASDSAAGGSQAAVETSAQGFGGDVVVATALNEDGTSIESVTIVDCSAETPEIGQAAAPEVAAAIAEQQSLDVDGVSGATMTSDAVKSAVEAAIVEAGFDVSAFKAEEAGEEKAESETNAAEEPETDAAADTADTAAEESETNAAAEEKETSDEETAAASEEAVSEEEASEAAEASGGEAVFTAGEFEGTGAGRNGEIKVKVTLSDTGIENVEVTEHSETDGIGNLAFDGMIPQMIERQTVDVDTVSGATLTSEGLKEAVTDALKAAGIDAASLKGKEADTAKEPAEDQEIDADVVIVGAGGAGMAAAASASEQGANVVVLEKMSFIGGNTTLGEGTYNVADPERQKLLTMTEDNKAEVEAALAQDPGDNQDLADLIADTKADYEAYLESGDTTLFDSANWHALQTYEGGGCIGNIPLIRTFAEGAVDTLDWLENTIGVPFKDDYIFMAIGGKWARGHQVDLVAATGKEGDGGGKIYIDRLREYAEKNGAQIITDAKVTKLIIDENGAAAGAIAECSDGSKITVNAPSVVLSTGGFAANSELVYEYSGGTITTTMTSCAKSSMGDGIKLAEEAGGTTVDLDQIQVHPLGDPIDDCGCVAMFVGNWLSATEYMFVNKEGERFVKEDGTRYEMSMAELEQTDDQMWLIVDSSEIEGDESRKEQIESLIADGHSVVADTLEELAEKIDVDPEVLTATVEKYNKGMLEGKDEFGKATSPDSVIETAPFYASLRTPTVHHTMGGVQINTETQVLDADGNPIPGLYAAGEVTGAIHGNNRLGGNAYPDIMTFGKIAGENAAKAANVTAAASSDDKAEEDGAAPEDETTENETAENEAPEAETAEDKTAENEAAENETAQENEAAAESAYAAGTYEAAAKGFAGDVKVSVTIGEDGNFEDVSVTDCRTETLDLGQKAAPEMAKAILETQSVDVDGVSGATLTSEAVRKAVIECLMQAAG